jgi:hypothetical protein
MLHKISYKITNAVYALFLSLCFIFPNLLTAQLPEIRINREGDIEVNENNTPSISFMVVFNSVSSTYYYETKTVETAGTFARYEETRGNGNSNAWREIDPLPEHDDNATYFFGGNASTSSFHSKYSNSGLYPPYSSSCFSKDTFSQSANFGTSVLHFHEDQCIPSVPYAPSYSSVTRIMPITPEGFLSSGMRAVNCNYTYNWDTPFSEPGRYSTSTGTSTQTESSTAGVVVSGDPALEYFIEFDIVAWDLQTSMNMNITGSRMEGGLWSSIEGDIWKGNHVKGYFSGAPKFYPISVSTDSKCYGFSVSNVQVHNIARRATK